MARKRFKTQPWQIIPCPRCNSPDTRFFCYNGPHGTKPKHYCNACRRYWIRGGALRHAKRIPTAKRRQPAAEDGGSPAALAVAGSVCHAREASCRVELRGERPWYFSVNSPAREFSTESWEEMSANGPLRAKELRESLFELPGLVRQDDVKPLSISNWVDEGLNRDLLDELWAAVLGSGEGEERGRCGLSTSRFQWQQQLPLLQRGEELTSSSERFLPQRDAWERGVLSETRFHWQTAAAIAEQRRISAVFPRRSVICAMYGTTEGRFGGF